MPQKHLLDYGCEPPPRSNRLLRFALIAILAILPIPIYLLQKLEVMPYRPPYDMNTFLGGSELAFVRALISFLQVFWCVTLVVLVLRVWRGKREN